MLVTLDLTLFKLGREREGEREGRKNYAKPFIEPLAPASPLATRRISFSYSSWIMYLFFYLSLYLAFYRSLDLMENF